MKKTILALVVCMTLGLGDTLNAQTPPPQDRTIQGAGATPEQTAAATRLLDTMKMEKIYAETMDGMLEQQLQGNPQMAGLKKVMKDFMNKHLSWEVVKGDIIKVYAEEFTVPELNDMNTFYATPTGQKLASKMGVMSQKQMAVTMQRMQQHQGELMQAIQQEMMKNNPGMGQQQQQGNPGMGNP